MTTPGVMTKFKIKELSGVDRPAQAGARAVIMKRAETPEEIAAAAALAKAKQGPHPDHEGDPMSSEIKKALGLPETATDAELAAAITKAATSIAALETATAELAIAKALASMTDVQKAYHADLAKSDAGKAKAFLDMKAEDKDAEVKKAASGDETVTLEGRTISKRAVGEDTFAILKGQAARIEANEAEIRKANEAAATATFEKAASEHYKHLAGTVAERGAVLKYLSLAPDDVKKSAETILKAAQAASEFAFTKRGTSVHKSGESLEGQGGEPTTAGEKLTKMASDLVAKSTTPITFAKAYDQVIQANPDLYEEATSADA